MTSANDILEGNIIPEGDTAAGRDEGTAAAIEGDDAGGADALPRSGSGPPGSVGVGALGGGAVIAGDAPGSKGQAGPDGDGGSR